MLESDRVEKRFNVLDGHLPVFCRHGEQLAASEFLRSATFIDINVRCLGADDGVVRLSDSLQSQHIRTRAAEDKVNINVFAEVFAKSCHCCFGVRIVAVGDTGPFAAIASR